MSEYFRNRPYVFGPLDRLYASLTSGYVLYASGGGGGCCGGKGKGRGSGGCDGNRDKDDDCCGGGGHGGQKDDCDGSGSCDKKDLDEIVEDSSDEASD